MWEGVIVADVAVAVVINAQDAQEGAHGVPQGAHEGSPWGAQGAHDGEPTPCRVGQKRGSTLPCLTQTGEGFFLGFDFHSILITRSKTR